MNPARPEVVVVRTGTANLASVVAGLERAGARARVSESASDVEGAGRLVLPGVGSFGAAMARMTANGLVEPLRARLRAGRATLCICLGLQLLFEASEESSGVTGLGVVPGVVRRFNAGRVPQLGWNRVGWFDRGSRFAYYANSLRATGTPDGWDVATTDYGGPFIGAMRRGGVLACQFHPELSGPWGLGVIREWLGGGTAGPMGFEREEGIQGGGIGASSGGSLTRRVIPCLDVRDGRVVKGVRFQSLRDAGDPADAAAAYEAQGADEIVMLDVSATPEGRATAARTVAAIRTRLSIPLTVGGGVRSIDGASALLDAGADKVSVNTAAVREPSLLGQLAAKFGSQCTVLAIDARSDGPGAWQVVVRSGTEAVPMDAIAWARRAQELGAGEVLLTSWDRDGTRSGYDLALLRAVSGAVRVPVIASGGAAGPDHLAEALEAGADAVLAASIFHDRDTTVADVKRALAARGVPIRLEGNP